jgi:hypothetical protein
LGPTFLRTGGRLYESWNGVLVVNIPITVIPPPAQHCSNTRPALPRWTRGIEPNHPLPRPLAMQLCTMPQRRPICIRTPFTLEEYLLSICGSAEAKLELLSTSPRHVFPHGKASSIKLTTARKSGNGNFPNLGQRITSSFIRESNASKV